jgi:hypothetical protein
VGAPAAGNNGRMTSGSAYLTLGPAAPAGVDLLAQPTGVRIDGAAGDHRVGDGRSVASAGDFNGDGRADVVVGSSRADNNARMDSGSAYVVFAPSPPAPAAPGGAPAASDPAPRVTRLRVSRRLIRFTLSEAATARITVERAQPGRRVGRRCLPDTRSRRRRARCTRYLRAGTLTRRARRGRNSIAFPRPIGRRLLSPGTYRVTLVATDSAGKRSRPARASLRIPRR